MIKTHDDLHHTELHRAMLAAAEGYSLPTYHAPYLAHEDLTKKRKVEAEA